jgi:RNA polymerase sigma factor (sigma-70 family)
MKKNKRTPDFDVVIKLRNNHLVAFREALGWSAPEMARQVGLEYNIYIRYECLHRSPVSRYGGWKESALRLAQYVGLSPAELWPDVIQKVVKSKVQLKMTGEQALALAGMEPKALPSPEECAIASECRTMLHTVLEELSPRERVVIKKRFGINSNEETQTLEEVGDELGISRARVRQVERRALYKLRCKSSVETRHDLKEFASDIADV